jgi:pyruvate dehydrogenase E1 component alpha subunit
MKEQASTELGPLADPTSFHGAIDIEGHEPDSLIQCLERMLLIRRVEEVIGDMVSGDEVKCPCHLCIGQEACAVGVATVLERSRDRAFGAHRSHGHYLALGGSPAALFAEVLGKADGCSGGMGGSMHLVSTDVGLYGTVPVVGATIPITVGAALAARLQGSDSVSVAFFGDGATEEGVFHESMNLARVRNLGVIFVCENNFFSSHLHISLRQPSDRVSRYADMHHVPAACVDGNDVAAVMRATKTATDRARAGHGPTFLELVTYRWRGHVGPREDLDVGVRRGAELQTWKKRDPIRRLVLALRGAGALNSDDYAAVERGVAAEVDEALQKARLAPYPERTATLEYVLAGTRA